MRGRGVLVLLAVLGALYAAPGAFAAEKPKKVPRPTEGGEFAFKVKEASPYSVKHVVVHYVTSGRDAVPAEDANGNDVPDYVEETGLAGDEAAGAFVTFGFKRLLPDTGGGNFKVDIYLKRLPQDLLGVAIPHAFGVGGGFMMLDTRLNPAKGRITVASLRHTVAHELFHMVQYSYVPNGDIPAWAAEGMASAMAIYAFPFSQDKIQDFLVDLWLKTPWVSLYDERFGCARCYGGAIWWRFMYQLEGRTIPEYMGRLFGYQKSGQKILDGTQPLEETLKRYGHGGLHTSFTRFAVNLYEAGLRPAPLYGLRASTKVQVSKVRVVRGLSTHYIPIAAPAGSTGLRVAIASGGGPRPAVTLFTGGPKGRRFGGSQLQVINGKSYEFRFANDAERKQNMLIVTSGRKDGVAYTIAYQSF